MHSRERLLHLNAVMHVEFIKALLCDMCRERESNAVHAKMSHIVCLTTSKNQFLDTKYGLAGIKLRPLHFVREKAVTTIYLYFPSNACSGTEWMLLHLIAVMHVELIAELWHSSAICTERKKITHCACRNEPHCDHFFSWFFFLHTELLRKNQFQGTELPGTPAPKNTKHCCSSP